MTAAEKDVLEAVERCSGRGKPGLRLNARFDMQGRSVTLEDEPHVAQRLLRRRWIRHNQTKRGKFVRMTEKGRAALLKARV